ncbi:PREDICTED: 28S ribosomal protein S15, mitochondrial [Dinoponera quadriceps]|uniref:Small ribosomal subunit protein uS15m n=1 Tax=Dinoponera quadriceps TaxID=609295 RepID=A0A6P3Y1Y1_DINQU|nr:PREDICTED: 28S ribosomal protein S15, mitochondrial [Dinoponera quadriceps]
MMSVISNSKRSVRMTVNLLKRSVNLSERRYATLEDYKITWTRPKKISCVSPEKSGDQGIAIDIKKTDIPRIYNESSEMKNASDIVKRMFTLEFLPKRERDRMMTTKIVDLVKRHNDDEFSPEVKIARLTSRIFKLREIYSKYPKNRKLKVELKEAIDSRVRLLTKLRTSDYRCFEYTLEKLNLIYKPYPDPPNQITKRESLTRLTEKHCNEIVQKKMDAYKAELKAQQKDFFAEKAEKLAFIREEEIACGLEPTISEEDVALAKRKAMEYQT